MKGVILDALKDSLVLVPFLLVIYIGIAWLEYRFGERIQVNIRKAGKAGPLFGALFGCLPQCGFSVVGSILYTRNLITTGTLLAVFISTSDEAVPIIMADPSRISLVLPLLLTKVMLALVAGFAVDMIFPRRDISASVAADTLECNHSDCGHAHDDTELQNMVHVDGCCGHDLPGEKKAHTLILHPLLHTARVFAILFVVSVAINLLVGRQGAHIGKLLLRDTIWQPIIAPFVGLIPNCGASVAITDIYLKGGISFGALIGALSSSAGLGMLVFVKENRNAKDTLRVLGLLIGISIAAGIGIQYLEPYLALSWLH